MTEKELPEASGPDMDGDEISQDAAEFCKMVRKICSDIGAIHKRVKALSESPLSFGIQMASIMQSLEASRETLNWGIPSARCPECKAGDADKNCSLCRGTNHTSKGSIREAKRLRKYQR